MTVQRMAVPVLPGRIKRLNEIAHNLWWSWNPAARNLFRRLDYPLWRVTGHNPVMMLQEINPDKLEEYGQDSNFLSLYDSGV
jgi:starch phosphorylase